MFQTELKGNSSLGIMQALITQLKQKTRRELGAAWEKGGVAQGRGALP